MSWWDQTGDQQYKDLVQGTMNLFAGMIPSEESLDRMITQHLVEAETKIPRRVGRDDGFHASSVGDMCRRYETMKRALPIAQDQRKFAGQLLKRFQIGHAVHRQWQQKILSKMRVLKGTWECSRCMHRVNNCFMPSEPCDKCDWQINPVTHKPMAASAKSSACAVDCKWPGGYYTVGRDCGYCFKGGNWKFKESTVRIKEYDLIGSFDGIVLYDGVVERILEMKTKDVYAWAKMTEPHAKHVIQSNVYMWGTGLTEGVICYINKNSGEMKEFLVKFDQELIDGIKKNIGLVMQALKKDELPNGVCGSSREPRAKECPYRKICFKGEDNIEKLKELVGTEKV